MNLQRELPFDEEPDPAAITRRAFARLWLGCRDTAKRRGYRLAIEDARWRQIQRETR